ncbi:MAG: MraY family glycosyltransferase, partial [Bdellovibrionota bacterium]
VLGGHLGAVIGGLADEWIGRAGGPELPPLIPLARARLSEVLLLLLGGGLCVGVGLLDDRLGARLSPWAKLAVQALAAALAIGAGAKTSAFGVPWLNALISFLWIVAITNAFNFVDNMDGLAGGLVVISSLILWAVASQQGQFFMGITLLTLGGATMGFLPYNFPRARIYLGDAGSLFLGYTLAVLALFESYVTRDSPTLLPVLLPLVALTVPVFDMISVIVIRLKEGRPIYVGDKSHLSHRLVAMGMSRTMAVVTLYLIAAGLGLGALLLTKADLLGSVFVLAQWGISLVLVSVILYYARKVKEP